MRPQQTPLAKYLFLPLLAAVTIDLAPQAAATPRDPAQRSSQRTGGSSGASRPSSSSYGGHTSGSNRSSASFGGSRSSGSSGSRSSASFGGSRSSGSSGSRSSASFGSSRSSSSTSQSRPPSSSRSSSSGSTRSGSPSSAAPSPARSSGSSSSGLVRYLAPSPSPSPSSTVSSRSSIEASAPRSSTTDLGSGEAYLTPPPAKRAFPTPITSGRTTYARRFDGSLQTGSRATSTRGGTLGPNGSGSVTSAIEAHRRASSELSRVRAPDSPGARYRSGALGQQKSLVEASRSSASDSGAKTRAAAERLALNPSLAVGGSQVAGSSSFDGYGSGGPGDFGPTPSPYGYVPSYGGYWDIFGYYHGPYSPSWGWSFGWSSGWGFYTGWNWSFSWGSYPYGWYCPTSWYYPPVIYNNYGYDDDYDDDPVTVNVYADGQIGEGIYTESSSDDVIVNVYPDAVEADPSVEVNWVTGDAGSSAAASSAPIAGASLAPAAAPASQLSAAGLRYLELGDSAFSEMRFTDAVYFYGRAIEFEPDQGMLHLVLADALFATGDYHFAAFSIRRALTLEPSLVDAPVDKHKFYADPAEFDRQLATLELFAQENPNDADARLVLALNELFGGRPEAAMQRLEGAPTQVYGEADSASALILESARRARWGDNPPAEVLWKP